MTLYLDRNKENSHMIERQLKQRHIKNPLVLQAFEKIQRHYFVPEQFQDDAYGDFPLAIGDGQTISQPFVIALMMEYLNLSSKHEVLEVGTGSGYSTALLASIVQSVDSLEFYRDLLDTAQERLDQLRLKNITLWHYNGWNGPPVDKKYDSIIVWASPNRVPDPLMRALKPNGRMIIPVGKNDQQLVLIKQAENGLKQEFVDWVRFVPLIDGDPL